MTEKAVFLDRDGVLNELVDGHAPWSFEEFHLKPGTVEQIHRLRDAGYLIIVISNQPDILDGKLHPHHAAFMKSVLHMIGADAVYFALKRDEADYKPNNGAIEFYVDHFKIDRARSWMIGDRWKDIEAGIKSELTTMLIYDNIQSYPPPSEKLQPHCRAGSLKSAVDYILELENS
jgi:D-glycero-D-manno-heptose 1,7-bisphosphate phosphatase